MADSPRTPHLNSLGEHQAHKSGVHRVRSFGIGPQTQLDARSVRLNHSLSCRGSKTPMSSYVIASSLATASSDLAGLQETISAAYAAAAPSTTSLVAAAHDEVSAGNPSHSAAMARSFRR